MPSTEQHLRFCELVEEGNVAVLEPMLSTIELNRPKPSGGFTGFTPLMIALYRRLYAVAELLVASGADINARDKNGSTALMLFAEKVEQVRWLVERRADASLLAPTEGHGPRFGGANALLELATAANRSNVARILQAAT